MNAKPPPIAPANPKTIGPRQKLADTTREQRRKMTAVDLIELMGPLHVHHPDFEERQHLLLPMKNFAGVQPVISRADCSFLGRFRAFFLRGLQ